MNLVVNGFLLLTALVVGFIIGRSSRKKTTIGERTDGDTKPAIQAMLNSIDAGVLVVSKQGRIEHTNAAADAIIGTPHDRAAQWLNELPIGPDLEVLLNGTTNIHEQKISGDRTVQVRITNRHAEGGAVFVLHDITDLKKLEVIRSDFVANVSHELRTPVSVIRANAETLLDGALDEGEVARDFVSAIHRNSERISNLVSDLLDLARIEAGSSVLELQSVDLAEVVARTIGSVRTLADGLNITIHDKMNDSVFCQADEDALEQVLTNLIENAVKYGREEGNIWVRSYLTPGRIRLEVIDDGLGIESNHRTRLFERFYRVDKGRSRASGGTGLGLSIVKHLVNNMGGQVGMEPNRPTGSVFWITLPAS